MYLTPNVRRRFTVAHRGIGEPTKPARTGSSAQQRTQGANRRVAKPGFTRCGSATCGVIGFQQHLGLGVAVLGGVGWLIGSDHASFLLRRRCGAWAGGLLARLRSPGRVRARLVCLLRSVVLLPSHLAATPYGVFARINLIGAAGWGIAFVWTGYLFARSWHNSQTPWSGLAMLLTTAGAIMCIDHAQRRRAPSHLRLPEIEPNPRD